MHGDRAPWLHCSRLAQSRRPEHLNAHHICDAARWSSQCLASWANRMFEL